MPIAFCNSTNNMLINSQKNPAKTSFYQKKLEENKKDIGKQWNKILGRKKKIKQVTPKLMTPDGKCVTDTLFIGNEFNNFLQILTRTLMNPFHFQSIPIQTVVRTC